MIEDNRNSQTLSANQQCALDLLIAGKTVTEAASEVGVARETVSRWRHNDPEFKAAYFAAMQSISEANQKKRLDAQSKAIDRLMELADSDDPSIALRACSALLKLGVHLPEGAIDPEEHRREQKRSEQFSEILR